VWSTYNECPEATAVTAVRVGAVAHPAGGNNNTMNVLQNVN